LDTPLQRVLLSTGVSLDYIDTGPPPGMTSADAPVILFLHGFPESHRTWRHQIAALRGRYRCIAPDQRGYARSDKPEGVEAYQVPKLVADVFALADALGVVTFTLAAHDWGGAVGWAAALKNPARITRLIIANAPHPYVYQHSLIYDRAQREAAQYIRVFRGNELEARIAQEGLDWYFDKSFMKHLAPEAVTADDRAAYLREWANPGALTAMFNWYRASPMDVPPMDAPYGDAMPRPPFLDAPFPKLPTPTLVVWGMRDPALTPSQLEGLDQHVPNLSIHRIPAAGHFSPWEAPDEVTAAITSWLDVTQA
jgi:pimeloyl-ACP methyl ester carboxylesterase